MPSLRIGGARRFRESEIAEWQRAGGVVSGEGDG